MSAETVFLNDLKVRLFDKYEEQIVEDVIREAGDLLQQYEINEKSTELAVSNGVPHCLKVFMVTKKIEGRSDATLTLYNIALQDFFEHITKPVDKITSNDIRLYLYELKERRKLKDITLDSRRCILSSFFTWCHNDGYILKKPMLPIAPIKFEQVPREPFSDVQMENIRKACRSDRDKAIIETLYATGCRVSELVGLKLSDIDFQNREVKLFGKGKKHRVSYLNARAEVAIENYLKSRKGDSEYLFLSTRKPYDHIKKEAVERIVRNIGSRAEINKVFPHRIRHTTATDALDHGMPVTEVQAMLGHEKLDTTMIYAKVRQSNVQYDHRKCVI